MNKKYWQQNFLRFTIILLFSGSLFAVSAQSSYITGKVVDAQTKETLPGVTVVVDGTSSGTNSDGEGNFKLKINPGTYSLSISYISYKTIHQANIKVEAGKETKIDFQLEAADMSLKEVEVIGKVNRESENILLLEQKQALIATQAVGAREMSRKGASNAEAAVAQVSGISKQDGVKNVFVRGLGDRYNATTLNGFPIPSEDPEYKNIALDFFSSEVIQNIAVSKVFSGSNIGDVGGAIVDINSKELMGDKALGFDVSGGINSEAVNVNFLRADASNYLGFANAAQPANNSYNFPNGLDPSTVAFPMNHSYGVSGGKLFHLGESRNPLSFFVVASHSRDYSYTKEIVRSITTGDEDPYQDQTGNKFSQNTNQLVLANANFGINRAHTIAYNFMLLHANNEYVGEYVGKHAEKHQDSDSRQGFLRRQQTNDNMLLTQQLLSDWTLSEKLKLKAGFSYNNIKGLEPDRRENYLSLRNDGSYSLTGSNRQKRFFSELKENDFNVNSSLNYKLNDAFENKYSSLEAGYAGRFVNDRFEAIEYNYDPYSGSFLLEDLKLDQLYNQANYSDGDFGMKKGEVNYYHVGKYVHSAYLKGNYQLTSKLTGNVGFRLDYVDMTVDYSVDHTSPGSESLDKKFYYLPSLNLKYDVDNKNSLRLGVSKTYTLPQSKEISPYRYVNIGFASQGNTDLKPSDNYNFDLKWDYYLSPSELLSLTGFYKHVANPIARVEAGNSAGVLKYDNISEFAKVAGLELELRKNIINNVNTATSNVNRLSLGLNASYIYTNLGSDVLNPERKIQLEGAAPFIGNFDISYNLMKNEKNLLASLVFNYFSDRVHTIGMLGFKDIVEEAVATLDFVSSYKFNKKFSLKLKASNLLDPSYRLTRERSNSNAKVTLNEYKKGINISLGVSYEL